MGIVFCLIAECGSQRSNAALFSKHFDGLKIAIPDAPTSHCETDEMPFEKDIWCSIVFPVGAALGGPYGKDIPEFYAKEKLTQIGWILYEHLRSAPAFRYAQVGIDPPSHNGSLATRVRQGMSKGLVVARDILVLLDVSVNFQPFSDGYMWIPYEGDEYGLE
jgi:hypothetical protein